MSVVARVILVLTLPAGLACAAFGPRARPVQTAHQTATAIAAPSSSEDHASADDDSGQADVDKSGAVDLYGNQVSDAVAKYKLDATGTLYELHSPQIELPRLGSPKS